MKGWLAGTITVAGAGEKKQVFKSADVAEVRVDLGAGNDRFLVAANRNLGGAQPYERNTVSDFVASGANADKLLLVGVTIPTGSTASRAATSADLHFVQQYGGTELRVADQAVAFLKGVNATSLNSSMVELRTSLPELTAALTPPSF
jgi:Ca2+-binding RTX toxin-like protein